MPTLRQNLRALPRPAWVLFGGAFINRFGTFVMPFLAIYLTRRGFTPAQAGIAIGAYGAGHLIASIAGGHLADRIGRRNTIALSMFGSAATMLALSQARTLPLIAIFTFAVGAIGEIYRPAANALLGDLVAPEQRIAAFGMYRFAVNLGFAAGPATAGFLANRSFFLLFAGDALTSFAFGCVAFFALPHGLRSSAHDEEPAAAVRVALRDRTFVTFLLATLCMTWIEFQYHSTLPLHIEKAGYSPSTYGTLISLNGLLIVCFELSIVSWSQRFQPQLLIALGYGLTGVGFAMTGLAHNVVAIGATVVLWTFGEMTWAPVTGAFVTGLAPERYRGRYMGLWLMTWSCGMLLGPAIGMVLYAYNETLLWLACGASGILSASLAYAARPRADAAQATSPTALG
ncbi:MAG: MFS transporter [Acidobacteria bacterium]|nr:MFS transporter [Acidobacteriota bacterium]MBV9478466.1 MFS transporter [Acidobacteriota bacterium]